MTTDAPLVIDVQGYFTAGQTAAGGFVPLTSAARIVNTASGLGIAQAKLSPNTTTTIDIAGNGGVPDDASAVFLNFTIVNAAAAGEGHVVPFAADKTKPATSLNFAAGTSTAIGATVALSKQSSTAGQIKLYVSATAPVDVMIDVAGYYTTPNETNGVAAFQPASTRVVDAVAVAANTTKDFQIAGVGGVPALGSGIGAVVANIQVEQTGAGAGYVNVWPEGLPEPPTSVVSYSGASTRSNLMTVALGPDGRISVRSAGPAVTVFIDVQGWYASSDAVVVGGQSITSRAVNLRASNAGVATGRPWVSYLYQTPGAAFVPIPTSDVKDGNDDHPESWPDQIAGTSFRTYEWDMRATLGSSPGTKTVLVRACYSETESSPSSCGAPWTVTLATGEYAYSSASVPLGPGSLSLATGNFQLDATDASVTTALGEMSLGRTLTTLSPNSMEDSPAASVFGPGWVTGLYGPDAGAGELSVDDTQAPTHLSFETADGDLMTYRATSTTTPVTYPITYTGTGTPPVTGRS